MKIKTLVLASLIFLNFTHSAQAISNKSWKNISDIGVFTLLGSALGGPMAHGDWKGAQQAVFSIGTAEGGVLLGKTLFPEQRPDHSDNNSFPSGHAAVAFSSATTLYKRYGWQVGLPAYAVASLTAGARVGARKHHWYDVVAGATIGTASGWFFTDAHDDKVVLIPWADTKSVGVTVAYRW